MKSHMSKMPDTTNSTPSHMDNLPESRTEGQSPNVEAPNTTGSHMDNLPDTTN